MKKHQFVKTDCQCRESRTNFTCKYCGAVEHCSMEELRRLSPHRAACTAPDALETSVAESLSLSRGGTLDCLAPDYATWAYTGDAKNTGA